MLATRSASEAQPTGRVYRIGILSHSFATSELVGPRPQSPYAGALLDGMRELGYEYGKHFVTEARGGEGRPERWASTVAELLNVQIDVVVASGLMLPPLKEARPRVPVVMAAADDPVASGLVASLGQPGGQFTGLSHQMVETTAKRLELLKELVPGAASVAVLSASTRGPDDLDKVFKDATDLRAGAFLVAAGGFLFRHARRVVELVAKSRLAAMYPHRRYTEVGGLMSYNDDLVAIWRRAATYVDKILKGAKPADLPIEQPTKFELVVNVKTARTLGLTIPPSLLLRADQVIE